MALHPGTAFLIGSVVSFCSTIPFGPVNLSVVDTTINRSLRAGLWVSAAAALGEIVQSLIALHGSLWLSHALSSNPWIKAGSFAVFVTIGTVFLAREKPTQQPAPRVRAGNNFIRGLCVALFNPQALPFWVFVLTYLETTRRVHLNSHQHLDIIAAFLAGVLTGKLSALILFALLGRYLSRRVNSIGCWMNRLIGGLFIGIGLIQGFQALMALTPWPTSLMVFE